jgi:hypothetical protein
MTSQIVRTNPTAGTATTASVRDNFGFGADEITVLQRSSTDLVVTSGGVGGPYIANFGTNPSFAIDIGTGKPFDGARISIRVNVTNATSPLLTVSPGNTPVTMVRSNGLPLVAGDIIEDNIYDLIYNATNGYWVVLNASAITSQDSLLTTILGGLYPVGSLLTTTNSANPGNENYFFSGITFGTWEAYAQGRTLVGVDTGFGTVLSAASSLDNIVTIVISDSIIGDGDLITVDGFTGDSAVANGSHIVISAVNSLGTGLTTITYAVTIIDIAVMTFTDFSVVNQSFDTVNETGGEKTHLQTSEEVGPHRHHVADDQTINRNGSSLTFNNFIGDSRPNAATAKHGYVLQAVGASTDATVGLSSGPLGLDGIAEDQIGANNMQPYITTYIWKRVVTPTP